MSDENENGVVDVIDVDDKPAPPKRIDSLTSSVQEELYRRLINGTFIRLLTFP